MDRAPAHPPAAHPPGGAASAAAPVAAAPARPGGYLTFRLGAEEYAIDILRVQEIRSYEPPTRIANAPPFLKGVIDLRGVIVPIVDLRVRIGRADAAFDRSTVVIVLNLRERTVGAVVDAVCDVLELPAGSIRPAPATAPGALDGGSLTGIGSVGERMLILIDIETLLDGGGVAAAPAVADGPTGPPQRAERA